MSRLNSINHSEKCIEPLQQRRLVEQPKEMIHGPDNRRTQAKIDFSKSDFEEFERHYGLEVAERLRQRLVNLVRVELFQGDQVADLGNGKFGTLLHDRHEQYVLLVTQLLSNAVQQASFQDEWHDVAASATLSKANMGSDDAFVLKMPAPVNRRSTDTALQITVLSNDRELMPRLERSLRTLRANFTCVETIDAANKIIESGQTDLTIVDVQGADVWPSLAFQLFEEWAASDIVVVLCSDADDARHHRERSLHTVDIFPNDAIDDHRFQCVIQAALLRAEVVSSDKIGHGIAPAA